MIKIWDVFPKERCVKLDSGGLSYSYDVASWMYPDDMMEWLSSNKDQNIALGIQSPNLRMVMELKYFVFWRWLYTPIILWQGNWIARVGN